MLKKLAFVCLFLALSVPAYATTMDVAWGMGPGADSNWHLDYSNNAPVFTTCALNGAGVNVGENNSGGYADGQLQGLGQMFNVTGDGYSVKAISIKISGFQAAGDYSIAIYDIGPSSNYTNVTPDPYDVSTKSPEFSAGFTTGAQGTQVIAFNFYDGTVDPMAATSICLSLPRQSQAR